MDEQQNSVNVESVEVKHPLYSTHTDRAATCLALYNGGAAIEQNEQYLLRHPFETEKQWDIRKKRSTYRNFAAPVVDVFSAAICEDRPERTLPAPLQGLENDVDKFGGTADAFFGDVVRLAAATGARFVLVDMQGTTAQTVEEDKLAGRRSTPYFVAFDAVNVLDWGFGADGKLDWCVLRERTYEERQPFVPATAVTYVSLWNRTKWERYKVSADQKVTLEAEGTHSLGCVPVVPFLFEQTSPMTGLSCLDDVTSLIVRIYRRDSELDKLLFDCAVPLMHMAGITEDEAKEFVKSSANAFVTSSDARLQYVEPMGTSFTHLTDQIAKDESSVREIALRMVRPDSAVGQSADAKMLDKSQLDSQLARFAKSCASSEAECWRIAAKWMNVPDADISTPYNEDYDVEGVDTAITTVLLELRRNGDISRNTLLRAPAMQGLLPPDFDAKEDEVEREQEARAGGAPIPPAGGGMFRKQVQNPTE